MRRAKADLRIALATTLFKAGMLSMGRAARVAGVGAAEMVSHLSRLGITVVRGDRAEAGADLETLDEWLASGSPAVISGVLDRVEPPEDDRDEGS